MSSEIFSNNLTQAAASEYVPPLEPTGDNSESIKTSAEHISGIDNTWHINNNLREVDVVQKIYEHVKSRMRSSQIEWEYFMTEDNIQKNTENISDPNSASSIESLMMLKAIDEVNEDVQIGFKTSENHLETLKTHN